MKIGAAHLDTHGPPHDTSCTKPARTVVRGRQDEFFNVGPRAHVLLEGSFHTDRFLRAGGGDGTRINAPRKVVQVVGGGRTKELGEAREWSVGEIPDRVDPLPVEDRRSLSPNSPQRTNGQSVEEVDRSRVRDEEQAVGLGMRGGDFGDRLGGGDPDGCR